MSKFADRRRRLADSLAEKKIDALLVMDVKNVSYLTGFTGDDSYFFVSPQHAIVISDARYTTQLEEECPDVELRIRKPGTKMHEFTGALLKELKVKRIGLEAHATTLDVRDAVVGQAPEDVVWTPVSGLVEALRVRKDADEIATTRKAVKYAQEAFAQVTANMKLSDTEWDVAAELEYTIRKLGGQGCSFEPIIAVGPRSALPHARASHLKLSENPILLIDWGAFADGYASDLTRVLATGSIPPKFEQVYRTVLAAQMAAIQAIGPSKKTQDIDAVARGVITDAGFGELFGHGLGHGLGLYIHEAPRLAPNTDTTLEPGMIVTVEPGIYLPGEFGVRIEDDILVTETGHEVLTSTPKQWENVFIQK